MADAKRGLGRGFDSLIPTAIVEEEFDVTAKVDGSGNRVSRDAVIEVPAGLIDPNPHQPRKDFKEDQLEALAASIRVHGILQPLIVTKNGARYELIAGERRLRSAKLAGLASVPVIVRSFDEQEKLELAIIENIQRAELNPIELGTAYRKLVDEFNVSLSAISQRVGKAVPTISNTMRLLNLPVEVKRAVVEGTLVEGSARAILLVEPEKQLHLFNIAMKNGWGALQIERYARGLRGETGSKMKAQAQLAATSELTMNLGRYLGTKVTQMSMAKGGRLIIEYYSDEELERIYKTIRRD